MKRNTVTDAARRTHTPADKTLPTNGRGVGQLTLAEHSLCPLDARASLQRGLLHRTSFQYSDEKRRRKTAHVEVSCPQGLSAHDEFYLWGLLALTLSQPQPDAEFHATPHYCLRQLGLVDTQSRRGGRQYQQFTAAVERLSWVTYGCDAFYDPVRGEHCRVRFSFFSYRLPLDPNSSRVWRFYWDPLFFEFVKSVGGSLWFDIDRYRSLSPAGRRLFLFVSKVFARSEQTPRMDLKQLAVDVLGLSSRLPVKHLLAKTRRTCAELVSAGLIMEQRTGMIQKKAAGQYDVMLHAVPGMLRPSRRHAVKVDCPLAEPLQAIGLDAAAIARVLRQFSHDRVREWVDITLAAKERFGPKFFKRSPMAYLIDNLKKSVSDGRTPPDWWHDIRKAEERKRDSLALQQSMKVIPTSTPEIGSRQAFERVRNDLINAYSAAGLDSVAAQREATRAAQRQMAAPMRERSGSVDSAKDILANLPLKLL